jgi:hypothetical protein
MSDIIVFREGGYRYIKAVFQYSSGVAAEPGFEIERARLARALPLKEGFAAVEAHLQALSRPTVALCACELRSPKPFSVDGFTEFNREYVKVLARWGIYRDEANPVARTNVCPEFDAPPEPSLHAFSYTVPSYAAPGKPGRRDSFIIAGGGEVGDGPGGFGERIVRRGDTSREGMREKIRHVVGEMERRLRALGFGWKDALATQAYSVQDLGPFMADEIARRGIAPAGLTWHFARPPVIGLEYEMDVRGAAREIVI